MTLPLSKEQIEAIQARAEKARWDHAAHANFIVRLGTDIPALCQQALRAIELEAECTALRARDAGLSLQCEELQSELAATRKALEEITKLHGGAFALKKAKEIAARALPSPQVKP